MTVSITNRIASDRNITVWVVPEETPGDLAYPAATDIVGAFDITYPTQVPEYTNSKERAQTRDVLNRCQGSMPAGEFAFSTYARPDGLGIVPQEHNLIEGLSGLETILPGTSVIYALQLQKKSYSIWFLVDHTMIFCKGATIGAATLNLEDCSLIYQWSGKFMLMGVTGTDPLTDAVSALETEIQVTNTDKYSPESLVAFADSNGDIVDDNGGSGYKVGSVQDKTHFTITPGAVIGAPFDGFVAPFNPGGALSGNPLETRTATVTMDGVVKPIVDFEWTVTDEPEYLDREKTPSGHPESYAETQREVGGEISLVFRRDDAIEFKKAFEGTQQEIILTCGDLPGYILEIIMPRCQVDVPAIEEAEPIVEIKMPYTAIAVTGEDSYTAVYK